MEAEVKERGITMSAPMVRALLDGTKTQTRRPVKPQPRLGTYGDGRIIGHDPEMLSDAYHVLAFRGATIPLTNDCRYRWENAAPHGPVGRRLWVREKWHATEGPNTNCVRYRADEPAIQVKWRPSILMPRWASRITLEVTDVRLERVQSITEEDARAEGVESKEAHAMLWDAINGGGSWAANPFVFAYSFRRIF